MRCNISYQILARSRAVFSFSDWDKTSSMYKYSAWLGLANERGIILLSKTLQNFSIVLIKKTPVNICHNVPEPDGNPLDASDLFQFGSGTQQSAVFIARSNMIWYCIQDGRDWDRLYRSSFNPEKISRISPQRASYGVPYARILEQIDRIVTAPRCISLPYHDVEYPCSICPLSVACTASQSVSLVLHKRYCRSTSH